MISFMPVAFALMVSATGQAQRVERDVAYGSDSAQRLDLFLPDAKLFSTVVFVHGGSLTSGDKRDDDYRNACGAFPAAGIACASINYRLAPAHSWPAPAEDVAAAVAWIQKNIAGRGGDPGQIYLFGHSSGATLVAIVATDDRFLEAQGLSTQSVRGVIPMGSIMWDDDLEQAIEKHGRNRLDSAFRTDPDSRMFGSLAVYQDHWPIRHIHRDLPPFLFLIAEAEQEHPPVLKTNRKFVEDARALSNCAAFKVLPGRTHYSAVRNLSAPNDSVFQIIVRFIRNKRSVC